MKELREGVELKSLAKGKDGSIFASRVVVMVMLSVLMRGRGGGEVTLRVGQLPGGHRGYD